MSIYILKYNFKYNWKSKQLYFIPIQKVGSNTYLLSAISSTDLLYIYVIFKYTNNENLSNLKVYLGNITTNTNNEYDNKRSKTMERCMLLNGNMFNIEIISNVTISTISIFRWHNRGQLADL